MSKPIIAIDVDEVLADYASEFVLLSNKLWGTNFRPEDYHEDWLALWGVDMNEAMVRRQIMLEDRMQERLKHDDEAVDVLKHLAERFTLKILTARDLSARDITLEWLGRHYPMFTTDDITFAGIWDNPSPDAPRQTKGAIAKNMGVNYIIDDQLKHCRAASEHGIKALLFGDYSWNQTDDLPEGITRVSNWNAVQEYFNGEPRP